MSNDPQTPRRNDNWRKRTSSTPPDELATTRRLLKYLASSFYDGAIDDKGVGSIAIPNEWREGHKWSVPPGIECNNLHRRYASKYEPFSRAFRGEFEDFNVGVSFWLSPEALTTHGDDVVIADIERMAQEVAKKLGLAANEIEARYVFPSEEMAEKMGNRGGVGICLVGRMSHRKESDAAYKLLAETSKEKSRAWKFMGGKMNFETYTQEPRFNMVRSAIAIRDVTNGRCENLPILPVSVRKDHFHIDLNDAQANYLDGPHSINRHLYFNAKDCWRRKGLKLVDGHGLAIFLDPSFFSSYRNDIEDAYYHDVEAKLESFCVTLQKFCKAPIDAYFVGLEDSLTHAHMHAPSMIILTNDAAHQHLLAPHGVVQERIETLEQFKHPFFNDADEAKKLPRR